MLFDISGKNALITGASRGLGLGIAEGFAQAGANLILVARSKDKLETLAKKLEPLVCESEYIITDSRNVAFQMVRPQIVAEFTAGDFVAEGSDGTPKTNPLLSFDKDNGYLSEGMVPGVSTLHFVFNRSSVSV